MTLKWEPKNELLVKNERTYRTRGDRAEIISLRINKHLCHLMKWIVENEDGTNSLGPNMKMELRQDAPDKIPDRDIAGQYEDLQEGGEGERVAVFFKKVTEDDGEYYRFSFHCNWRFIDLNAAYLKLIESQSRSPLIRSDVCNSSFLGVFYFEPSPHAIYSGTQGCRRHCGGESD